MGDIIIDLYSPKTALSLFLKSTLDIDYIFERFPSMSEDRTKEEYLLWYHYYWITLGNKDYMFNRIDETIESIDKDTSSLLKIDNFCIWFDEDHIFLDIVDALYNKVRCYSIINDLRFYVLEHFRQFKTWYNERTYELIHRMTSWSLKQIYNPNTKIGQSFALKQIEWAF
tara:strand:+ start:22585 stop:23094 length:510 start_codon:yes stop_codon:yes gene_type:complete